jgi:hypothetical protein
MKKIPIQTSTGADLLAGEGAIYLRIKKNLLICSTPKHMSKVSLVSWELLISQRTFFLVKLQYCFKKLINETVF